jgi:chromosome segregation ATPase
MNNSQIKDEDNAKSPVKLTDSVDDMLSRNFRDPCQRIMDTKNLLKEINQQIHSLQKWRDDQKKDLEKNLEKNRQETVERLSKMEKSRNDVAEYEKYADKLDKVLGLYSQNLVTNKSNHMNKSSTQGTTITEIEKMIAEKEAVIAQLSSNSVASVINTGSETKETVETSLEDLNKIKEALENWKDDVSMLIKSRNTIISTSESDPQDDNERLKKLIKTDKAELAKKNYSFQSDISDIEKELKEIEELMKT